MRGATRCHESGALELHRQDHHLHAVQMQPALQRQRGLVVQQARHPVLVAEDQLAGEKDAVGELALDFLGKLRPAPRRGRCRARSAPSRRARWRGNSRRRTRARASSVGLKLVDLLGAAIALGIDRLGADEDEILEVDPETGAAPTAPCAMPPPRLDPTMNTAVGASGSSGGGFSHVGQRAALKISSTSFSRALTSS